MREWKCYSLEGKAYVNGERLYGSFQSQVVYWAVPPSPHEIAVGALRILQSMREDQIYVGWGTDIEWEFRTDADLSYLLEQIPRIQPVTPEYVQSSVGGGSSEPIWPYVVGAAVLFG